MVTFLGHVVLSFEKPRLCKQVLLFAIYFLVFIIKECFCIEFSCTNQWMELPFNSCTSTSFSFVRNQCLEMRHNFSEEICQLETKMMARTGGLRKSKFLNFCSHYNLYKVIPERDRLTQIEGINCTKYLRSVECRDSLAEAMYNQFANMLSRVDCSKPYSVWNCTHCLHSYKIWACSTQFSIYQGNIEIVPCYNICTDVENRCPFFRPSPKTVHAGEPTFLCKSLRIEANESLSKNKKHCYPACYLTDPTNPDCALPGIKPEIETSNTNSSITSNCCCRHICNVWTNVICLVSLWLIRTFIQYMTIGLT